MITFILWDTQWGGGIFLNKGVIINYNEYADSYEMAYQFLYDNNYLGLMEPGNMELLEEMIKDNIAMRCFNFTYHNLRINITKELDEINKHFNQVWEFMPKGRSIMSKSNDYKTIRITREVSELLDNLKISNESYDTVIKQLIKDNERLIEANKSLTKILTNING